MLNLAVVFRAVLLGGLSLLICGSGYSKEFYPAKEVSVSPLGTIGASENLYEISPDGQWIVYQTRIGLDTDALTGLYSVPIGGSKEDSIKLSESPVVQSTIFSFVISPDSKRVIYRADQSHDLHFELFSVPIEGGDSVRLNIDLPEGGDVSRDNYEISPDSKTVVYRSDQIVDNRFELFSVPIIGGEVKRLNSDLVDGGDVSGRDAGELIDGFKISPDGQAVIYLADQEIDGVVELFVVPIMGGNVVKLNGDASLGQNVFNFRVSPDGDRVVYRSDYEAGGIEIYSVTLNGGDNQKLSDLVDSTRRSIKRDFQISTDSQRVTFLSYRSQNTFYELFSSAIDGAGEAVKLNDDILPSENVRDFRVSPDGQRVAYLVGGDDFHYDLFTVSILGGSVEKLNQARIAYQACVPANSYCPPLPFVFSSDGENIAFVDINDDLFLGLSLGDSILKVDAMRSDFIVGYTSLGFSSDNESVYFAAITGSGESRFRKMYSVNVKNRSIKRVSDDFSPEGILGFVLNYKESKSGEFIVYERFDDVLFSVKVGENDLLCFPIKTKLGKVASVCL